MILEEDLSGYDLFDELKQRGQKTTATTQASDPTGQLRLEGLLPFAVGSRGQQRAVEQETSSCPDFQQVGFQWKRVIARKKDKAQIRNAGPTLVRLELSAPLSLGGQKKSILESGKKVPPPPHTRKQTY